MDFKPIFGRYLNQPFHHTLIDFRLIYIVVLGFIVYWIHTLVTASVTDNISFELAAMYLAKALILIPIALKSITEMRQPFHSQSKNEKAT